ncbi:MAG: protein kinase domain-containing protein [Candidatus Sumerlaeaceae bacterium]
MKNSLARQIYDVVFWAAIIALVFLNRGLGKAFLDMLPSMIGPYAEVLLVLICLAILLIANYLRHAIAATVESIIMVATGGKPLNYEKGSYHGNLERSARRLEKKRDYSAAAETYETLESWPEAASAYERAGLLTRAAAAWQRAGDVNRAVELYEKEQNYEQAALHCATEGLRERAAKNWRLAGERAFEANLFTQSASYYEKAHDFERAGKIFETVQKNDEALRCYEKAGATDKVIELIKRVQPAEISRRSSENADMLRRCSELLVRNGKKSEAAELAEATDDFVRAAEIYESAQLWEKAAELYLRADQAERAILSIAHLPDRMQIAEFLARIAQAKGDWQTAGLKYEEAGKFNQAVDAYKRIRDFSAAARVYDAMGRYLMAAEMYSAAKDPKAAAGAYYKAHDWRNAAECFEACGDLGQAVEGYANAGAYLKAGILSVQLGDNTKAIEYLQRVAPASADYKLATAYLATAFYYQGRTDMARELFRRVIDQIPISAETLPIYYAYGRLLEDEILPESLPIYHQIMGVNLNFADVADRIPRLEAEIQRTMVEEKAYQTPLPGYYQAASVGPASAADQSSLGYYSGSGQPTVRTKTPTQTSDTSRFRRPITQAPETRFGDEGRYRIVEELGRGGMAIVYKALDLHLEREVALKTFPLSRSSGPGREEVFLREARLAARLSHPNIVTIFDSGHMNYLYYVAMEYVNGDNMKQLIKQKGPLSLTDAKHTLTQLAEALEYAHSMQVLHLDIKPGNVIQRAGSAHIKVVDFGLAKIITDAATSMTHQEDSQQTIIGTPQYMAPEQIQNTGVDARTDLYSLGLTLFYFLTGRTPFEIKKITDPLEIARMQVQSSLPRPTTLRATLPSAVDEIFIKCVQKSPGARFQSAREFLEALQTL